MGNFSAPRQKNMYFIYLRNPSDFYSFRISKFHFQKVLTGTVPCDLKVGVNHGIYHRTTCFLRRSSLAARISALISSRVSSGSSLASAALRCCINRSRALGVSTLSPLMANGILRLLTTAFTKMLKAVFALIPNCSQSLSNCDFISESILTVTADCAII